MKYSKRITQILFGLFIVMIVMFYYFMQPKSNAQIDRKFRNRSYHPIIEYIKFKDKSIRVLKMQKDVDTTLPTLIFVHGSPGSSLDFERYLSDKDLHQKANLFSFDRVGYGKENTGKILNSLSEETTILEQIIQYYGLSKVVLIGYSYGGGVVMAYPKQVQQKVVLAASVKGEYEPKFWALNLYKLRITRRFIPKIIQAAATEKLMHIKNFPNWEDKWDRSNSPVLVIHGEKDKIVPYKNALFLASKIRNSNFELLPLPKGNHALIWTDFEIIKKEILKRL